MRSEEILAMNVSVPRGTPHTVTLEKNDIQTLSIWVAPSGGGLSTCADFHIENGVLVQTAYWGNNWYPTYYQLALNGNQLTITQTLTSGNAIFRVHY